MLSIVSIRPPPMVLLKIVSERPSTLRVAIMRHSLMTVLAVGLIASPTIYDVVSSTSFLQNIQRKSAENARNDERSTPTSQAPIHSQRVLLRTNDIDELQLKFNLDPVQQIINRLTAPILSESQMLGTRAAILEIIRLEEQNRKIFGNSLTALISAKERSAQLNTEHIKYNDTQARVSPSESKERARFVNLEQPFVERYLEQILKLIAIATGIVALIIVLRKEKRDTLEAVAKLKEAAAREAAAEKAAELRTVS